MTDWLQDDELDPLKPGRRILVEDPTRVRFDFSCEDKLQRHPLSQLFHEYLGDAGRLHDVKQKDYGADDDPFSNVRASADWGFPAWVGCMMRANDKVKRLQTFAQKGELANESVIDAFMDLAVYAIIARILYEEEAGLIDTGSGPV